MRSFNVQDINSKKFVPYDIMPYLVTCYYDTENRPETFEEFRTFINDKVREKVGIHQQVMMNIDIITTVLMNEIEGI